MDMKRAGMMTVLALVATASSGESAIAQPSNPDARAATTLAEMTQEEKLSMLQGYVPQTWPAGKFPEGLPKGAGYVPGVPRVGIPPLTESDASLGVANMGGLMRAGDEATAMPAGLAMASTWHPDLIEHVGRAMGAEAKAKGFNVLLAGGINLVRDRGADARSNISARTRRSPVCSAAIPSAASSRTISSRRSSTTCSTPLKRGAPSLMRGWANRRCARAICLPSRRRLRSASLALSCARTTRSTRSMLARTPSCSTTCCGGLGLQGLGHV